MTPSLPPRRGSRPEPSRRSLLTGAALGAAVLGAGALAEGIIAEAAAPDRVRSVTVAFGATGSRTSLGETGAQQLSTQSRVLPGAGDTGPARRQAKLLETSAPWLSQLPAHRRDLAITALLDLWVLTDSLPATVASWANAWRFIWPRDAAFAAVAWARLGFDDLAWRQLLHMQGLQNGDGSFAARVHPDTGLAPDDRASQFDAPGLLLWAVSEVHAAAKTRGVGTRSAETDITALAPLLRRSTSRLLTQTAHGITLPPVTPDYWEVVESQVTLGTAAPTLGGLLCLGDLLEAEPELEGHLGAHIDAIRAGGQAFGATFARTFAANGLQRYPSSGGADSAVAYLPATGRTEVDAVALDRTWDRLVQPAGGIKPGHGWVFDRSSWTPSTSLVGLGYARLGQRKKAGQILDWLAAHRTSAGSLPEKITGDGQAVSVAPLSWTASNVIITLDELYGTAGTMGS